MSRTLVVYATKSECTTGIAEHVGQALTEAGADVDVRPATDDPDPAGYDMVIVGSGVRVGQWHAPAKKWVAEHAGTLKATPTALFTVCLTMAAEPEKADEVRAYTDSIISESGIAPVDVGLFAGWNDPASFSLPERLIMKAMKAPRGDFRDYSAVADWTREVYAAGRSLRMS